MRIARLALLCLVVLLTACASPHPAPPRDINDQPNTVEMWELAYADLREINKALNMYATENDGAYPDSLATIRPRFGIRMPTDPFTNEDFYYVNAGDNFILICLGADARLGGAEAADRDILFDKWGELPRKPGTTPVRQSTPKTKRELALSDMIEITKALNIYCVEHGGEYPESLDAIRPMFGGHLPRDPYTDEDFIYEKRGNGFILACFGADMKPGGTSGDDVDLLFNKWGDAEDEQPPSRPVRQTDQKADQPKRTFRDR